MNERISVRVVRRKGRKFYQAEFVDPITGKVTAKSTKETNRRLAERFAVELERELERGIYKRGATPWDLFKERYVEEACDGLREKSIQSVESTFRAVDQLINPKTLQGLARPDALSKFRQALGAKVRNRGGEDVALSSATVNKHLRNLRAAFWWAKKSGMLAEVPDLPFVKRAGTGAKSRAVTAEEFERMLDAVPKVVDKSQASEWEFLLRLLWLTGMRLGEALALRWFEGPVSLEIQGKRPVVVFSPEGQKANQTDTIPLTLDAVELINEREVVAGGFVVMPSRKVRTVDWPSRVISKVGAKALVFTAVGKAASAHDLRRGFATQLSRFVKTSQLTSAMRHKSLSTTMRYYVHDTVESLTEALDEAYAQQKRTLERTVTPNGQRSESKTREKPRGKK